MQFQINVLTLLHRRTFVIRVEKAATGVNIVPRIRTKALYQSRLLYPIQKTSCGAVEAHQSGFNGSTFFGSFVTGF